MLECKGLCGLEVLQQLTKNSKQRSAAVQHPAHIVYGLAYAIANSEESLQRNKRFCSIDCYVIIRPRGPTQATDSVISIVHNSHLAQRFGMMIHVVVYESGDSEVRVIIAILQKKHSCHSKAACKQDSKLAGQQSAGQQSAGEHENCHLQPIVDTELAFCCLLECLWF